MNASIAMANGTGTDPAEALQRAKEARRIQSAGRWYLLLILLGATYPLIGAAMLAGPSLAPLPPAASVLLMIGLVTLGLATRKRIDRARERSVMRGVPNLSWPPLPAWITTVSIVATAALFAGAGALMWAGFALDTEDARPIAAAMLLMTAGFCWNARRLRLWEYAVAALGPASVMTLCLLKEPARLGDEVLPPMTVLFGVPFLIAGIFLRRRWRAFVAALPKEGDA